MARMLIFTLPAITVSCTMAEARDKHFSEVAEWEAVPATANNGWSKFIEAWDTLQAAYTWLNRATASDLYVKEARTAIETSKDRITAMGQPAKAMRARTLMLVKNATRGYYSEDDNVQIMEGWRS